MSKFLNIIGSVLGLAVLAGGVAMAVPESRNWILDEVATTSNIYKTTVEENDNLKLEISELKTQRDSLLSSMTELDNQINATEDETTLETLQAKKTAILEQVETLNARIAELETQEYKYNLEVTPSHFVVLLYDDNGNEREFEIKEHTDQLLLGDRLQDILHNVSNVKEVCPFDYVVMTRASGQLAGQLVGHEDVFTDAYSGFSDNFDFSTKIYDASGRLIDVDELNASEKYWSSFSFETIVNESGELEHLEMIIRLGVTI